MKIKIILSIVSFPLLFLLSIFIVTILHFVITHSFIDTNLDNPTTTLIYAVEFNITLIVYLITLALIWTNKIFKNSTVQDTNVPNSSWPKKWIFIFSLLLGLPGSYLIIWRNLKRMGRNDEANRFFIFAGLLVIVFSALLTWFCFYTQSTQPILLLIPLGLIFPIWFYIKSRGQNIGSFSWHILTWGFLGSAVFILAIFTVVDVFSIVSNENFSNSSLNSLTTNQDVNYFSVVSVSPEASSDNNSEDTPIKITFNEPVRPDSLRNYFTVSPMIPGTFSQGASPNEVIFKANYTFGRGTAVKVILNKGLESVSGDKFTTDYTYNFYTRLLDKSVVFENNQLYSRWVNMITGNKISFNLHVGGDVPSGGTITIYKGTFDLIVSSLLYTNKTYSDSNYVSQTYLNYPVDISKMQKISEIKDFKDKSKLDFDQGEGLYYLEAKSDGKVVGSTWVNVTDQGLIVRQDDQKVTIATQNIKTGDINSKVKILLYNLQDKPSLVQVANIDSYGEIPIAYPQKVDLVVGQTENGVILVPLSIPETQADIRLNNNLDSLERIFLSTDRPTYLPNDTVKFSGIVRTDQDSQYSLPSNGEKIHIWMSDLNNNNKNIIDQTATIGDGGIFSGEFTLPASLGQSSNTQSLTLYAKTESDNAKYINSKYYTTFDIVPQNNNGLLSIRFDKNKYLKNDNVTAHIQGFDTAGNPLSNKSIIYTVYSKNYYEDSPDSVAEYGKEWGEPTKLKDKSISLDKDGKADIKIDQSADAISQAITLVATTDLGSGSKTTGAKTTLVQQGKIILTFGPSRQQYNSGDTIVSRAYARDLNGNPVANINLDWQIFQSTYNQLLNNYQETVLKKGTVTTDQNGLALIKESVTSGERTVSVRVTSKDDSGNQVKSETSISILQPGEKIASIYYHDLSLNNLDVSTDKLIYNSGDTANLTINSPVDENVLVTYESERIKHSQWLKLNKGDNNYKIPITSDLSPSFNLIFTYFNNETLFNDGLQILVSNPAKHLNITATSDKDSYTNSDSAQIDLSIKDGNGQPVKANVLVNVLDDNIFGLRENMPNSNLAWFFYSPRIPDTNFSASTLGIGTGGGCGGGSGVDINYFPNRTGKSYYWNTGLVTDQNGQLKITVPLSNSKGKLRVSITAVTPDAAAGETNSFFFVQ